MVHVKLDSSLLSEKNPTWVRDVKHLYVENLNGKLHVFSLLFNVEFDDSVFEREYKYANQLAAGILMLERRSSECMQCRLKLEHVHNIYLLTCFAPDLVNQEYQTGEPRSNLTEVCHLLMNEVELKRELVILRKPAQLVGTFPPESWVVTLATPADGAPYNFADAYDASLFFCVASDLTYKFAVGLERPVWQLLWNFLKSEILLQHLNSSVVGLHMVQNCFFSL